ncbi:oxygenase MpaB family protein [Streptomyces sp. NBC_01497]|uniref:oxygenase MpaB family protein n=1 Tax=Streptomyces sp. NBC_01497 TaxID=2903885 RepID=UPI002E35B13E|nr:oxygenase MpaB family protein [Streptomyces sp. NBC_01497]
MISEAAAHEVYRQLALLDFPEEVRMGLNLGFYRTFAVPGIATVLTTTGKMIERPKERAKATGALMYSLIENGLDTPEGTSAVARLTALHAHLPVDEAEFVYVLGAFCTAPLEYIDRYGWRPVTPAEREAAYVFYAGLGRRMGIAGVPGSYAALEAWMSDFEVRTFETTTEGRALLEATSGLLASRLPRVLAPLARRAADTLFDERLLTAFGRRPAPGVARWAMRRGLASRSRILHARRRLNGPGGRQGA